MSKKPVPIIILQYGKFDLTKQCLATLAEQTVGVETILVDGNSPGKDQRILEDLGKLADKSLFLEENLGYAGANNKAIKEVLKGDSQYFMVVNNDTELDPKCVEELVAVMEKNPKAAQVCAKVFYPDKQLQGAGGQIKQPLFEPQLKGHLEEASHYQVLEKVTFAPGVAVLMRAEAVREVGLIPEDYFMYSEDVDWSLEFIKAGWEVWYCPTAHLTHFESASWGSYNPKKAFYMIRSNVMLAKKWSSKEDWQTFKGLMRWKLLKQSIKHFQHPGYVLGMWQGFKSGLKAQ